MDIKTLLPELKRLVTDLSEDLLVRSTATAEVDAGLREAYTQIEKGGRTADAFEVWREDYLDQVAVAWVLGCVFVRFMEDNHLIDECWQAEDSHELYFREHPRESDREYFEHVFHAVGKIPACQDLFAEGKTPLWAVGPSGDAAMKLLAFWREIDTDSGKLKRTFNHERHETHETHEIKSGKDRTGVREGREAQTSETGESDSSFRVFSVFRGCSPDSDPTRFLGDLYQDLSERARKKYALLQTPVFVEEFILDRTLTPALDEFGLIHKTNDQGQLTEDSFRMIDPTCGSGHFLLGGFHRLFDLWIRREDNEVVAAQKAFDGVWGCDINPFAVAIAWFRLIVAALRACGLTRLKKAPAWTIHLATGDSLLFGKRWDRSGQAKEEQTFFETEEEGSWAPEVYACEDREAIAEVLGQQYHVVVGNPPYITPKDKALNQAYRDRYATCHRQYSLAVPFMKREFGKKLIEQYFAKVDLTHVVDTSGAYIPGHGTPTVILLGRNRAPQEATVRAVLGIKGEPSTPADPAQGLVWQSIVKQIDIANSQDAFTSTADVPRETFTSHPWSIGGGGASDLKDQIEVMGTSMLQDLTTSIGFMCITKEDNVFPQPFEVLRRHGCDKSQLRPFGIGEDVRDWNQAKGDSVIYPYDSNVHTLPERIIPSTIKFMWTFKAILENRKVFGGQTYKEAGKPWYEYGQIPVDRQSKPLSIAFAFVATHNHFVLDRGGKVFKQTAPIIKLPAEATEDDHLALLGFLNSSTACFWMKQVCHSLGGGGGSSKMGGEFWEAFYEHTGTKLQGFPVPKESPLALSRELDQLAQQYSALLPEQWLTAEVVPTAERLAEARQHAAALREQMIALQEELDWQCYELCGLINHEIHPTHAKKHPLFYEEFFRVFRFFRGCSLGHRPFEIIMARQMATGELQTTWFDRHGSTPITELPTDWPAEYRELVERRIALIESSKEIGLIEKPEYKRRWNTESWDDQQQRAVRHWLLDRLERFFSSNKGNEPRLTSVAKLADLASADADLLLVAAIYRDREDFDFGQLINELVAAESVPFLPSLRYKPAGLRKREVWERVWEMQREEDKLTTTKGTNDTKTMTEQAQESMPEERERAKSIHSDKEGDSPEPSEPFRVFSVFRGCNSPIPVPPKYTSADFLKTDFWRLRGKLDVPKERWIGFPHCETEGDPSLVVGWAGWNHLQQGTAIVAYYDARKNEGWTAERLTPLLAALDELLPWIHQWHPEIDPEYNETAGTSFQTLLDSEALELGVTLEQIRSWTPPAGKKGGRKKAEGGSKPRKTRITRTKEAEE